MATAVSVLCARIRMEEKWVIEALAAAGVPARLLPPSFSPWPIERAPATPLAAVGGNRLDVACALAAAGIPRPVTLLVTSEDAGSAAAARLGWPATLLPLNLGSAVITLLDRDIAEATLEHREVLGGSEASVCLIQAGAMRPESGVSAVVAGGRTAGISGSLASVPAELVAELAEAAAHALGSAVLGVEIAMTANGPVVWDVRPVPEFRTLSEAGRRAVARAIAELAAAGGARLDGLTAFPVAGDFPGEGFTREAVPGEVADAVALSA